jgi:5-(carboxyamino)imidazole ribonucleotide mutase
MKALILFGSTSDEFLYSKLIEKMDTVCETEFHVLSAHRKPVELGKVLAESKYDVVIGGAGLAAHLPGVIASKVKCPVFGLPVGSQFLGLDAFLSIVQMPSGVPVLAETPDSFTATFDFLEACVNKTFSKTLNVVVPAHLEGKEITNTIIEKAKGQAKECEVELSFSTEASSEAINLILVDTPDFTLGPKHSIYIPVVTKDEASKAEHALNFFKMAQKGGLWAGANNSKNAVIQFQKLLRGVLKC